MGQETRSCWGLSSPETGGDGPWHRDGEGTEVGFRADVPAEVTEQQNRDSCPELWVRALCSDMATLLCRLSFNYRSLKAWLSPRKCLGHTLPLCFFTTM